MARNLKVGKIHFAGKTVREYGTDAVAIERLKGSYCFDEVVGGHLFEWRNCARLLTSFQIVPCFQEFGPVLKGPVAARRFLPTMYGLLRSRGSISSRL